MAFQFSMFDNVSLIEGANPNDTILLLTWNVANPSIERARAQWVWLAGTGANVIVLTEIKASIGCEYLHHQLKINGYKVFNETRKEDSYGVLVAVKDFQCDKIDLGLNYLKSRACSIKLNTFLGEIVILGLYVPSRGNKSMRNVEKAQFQTQISEFIKTHSIENLIVAGDLNVVPRDHDPVYSVFGEWEYLFYESFINAKLIDTFAHSSQRSDHTWFSRGGNGFRFDFIFVSTGIIKNLRYSNHEHFPRTSELSDHSAVTIELKNSVQ